MGPQSDHTTGDVAGYFGYVTAQKTGTEVGSFANLESPYFVGSEHPHECMTFWFIAEVIWLLDVKKQLHNMVQFQENNGIDKFEVQVVTTDENINNTVPWRLDLSSWQSDDWTEGRIQLDAAKNTEDFLYSVSFSMFRYAMLIFTS